ncbi:hypothetical protein G6F54_013643 [Rhizopus delemar]|nr:hypothetical protein G6F54_013643 [Rhizopus delemar]
MELHERLEGREHHEDGKKVYASFAMVVAQIVVLDAVFSLDSVITAVGMVDNLGVMYAAVTIAMALMLVASKPLTRFPGGRGPGLHDPEGLPVRGHCLLDPGRSVQPVGAFQPRAQRAAPAVPPAHRRRRAADAGGARPSTR